MKLLFLLVLSSVGLFAQPAVPFPAHAHSPKHLQCRSILFRHERDCASPKSMQRSQYMGGRRIRHWKSPGWRRCGMFNFISLSRSQRNYLHLRRRILDSHECHFKRHRISGYIVQSWGSLLRHRHESSMDVRPGWSLAELHNGCNL